jgi:organic radical activating enzyme
MSLLVEMNDKAMAMGIPLSVHLDVTYRCNERCVHCYLDHDDKGEMTTAEIKSVLDQLAEAGVFFLVLSGGEVFMRQDFLEIVDHARRLQFNVKVKTNGVMIHEPEAKRLRELGVEQVQLSVYSHRPEIHDAITKLPGSLKRTINSIRFLKSQGLKVTMSNVMMTVNRRDQVGTHALAKQLGVSYTLDPTVTPKLDSDTSILNLRVEDDNLDELFANPDLVGDVEEFCKPPAPVDEDVMEGYSCSAGTPLATSIRTARCFPACSSRCRRATCGGQKFAYIWYRSPQMNEVRSIKVKDLTGCSSCSHAGTCTRCPGLAYMEGSMRGPSSSDCEKSFHRTGIPSANMLRKAGMATGGPLVKIMPMMA